MRYRRDESGYDDDAPQKQFVTDIHIPNKQLPHVVDNESVNMNVLYCHICSTSMQLFRCVSCLNAMLNDKESPTCVCSDDMHCVPAATSVSWVSKPFDVHKEPFATYAATNSPHCCELGVTPPSSEELQGM